MAIHAVPHGQPSRMSLRSRDRAATITVAGVGAALGIVAVAIIGRSLGRPGTLQGTPWPTAADAALIATLLGVGAVLRLRRPDNGMGWIFLVLGVAAAVVHPGRWLAQPSGGTRQIAGLAVPARHGSALSRGGRGACLRGPEPA